MRKAAPGALAVLLLVVAVSLSVPPALASECTVREAGLLRLINEARARRGLAPLRAQTALARAALTHSCDMMDGEYFSHTSQSGEGCDVRARRAGYGTSGCRTWAVAEVIGCGSGAAGTPAAVLRSWMRSAYHRAIILGPRWRDVGVGCASGTFQGVSGAWMYTVDVGCRSR